MAKQRQPLNLSRSQLAKFCPDIDSIIQFERIFSVADSIDEIGDVSLANLALSADAKAQSALEIIQRLQDEIELLKSRPNTEQNSLRADYIDFPVSGPHVSQERRVQWNPDDGTLDVGLFNGVILQCGQEVHYYAKNTSGVTIPNGASVMATGAVGASGKITIAKAVADGSISGDYMLGIATQDIADGAFGYVTAYGQVRGIDTTGTPYGEVWADGDVIYFSPTTAGNLTKVMPTAPALRMKMAIVTNAGPGGSGSLYVRAKTGETLRGLNDVYAPSTANYYTIQWNSTNSRWEETGILQGLKYGGTSTNYSFFEADGTYKAYGDATTYDDIFLPLAPKTTGVGSPTLRTLSGNIKKFTMAVGDLCEIDAAELVHTWEEGTAFEIHVHWATRGTNDATVRGVKWEIDYTWANMQSSGGTIVFGAATTVSAETSIAANEADLTNKYTSVATITPTGGKIGATLLLSLKRIASVINVAPANDPWVTMVGVHIKQDTLGSRTISAK